MIEQLITEIENKVSKVIITFQHNVLGRKYWVAQIHDRETFTQYTEPSFESGEDALKRCIEKWRLDQAK